MTDVSNYIGRFAPSPTGPLHFGSLVAALGSYLQARSRGGQWLLRVEDIDPPREVAGATDEILRALDHYGLHWDGETLYQSQRSEAYLEAIDQLHHDDALFYCRCSRKQIATAAEQAGLASGVYPGSCRSTTQPPHGHHAVRLLIENETIRFNDSLQGEISQQMAREVGDFVIRRADGLFAYQLAVVIDDAAQGITEVVRGSDLLDSTPRQILLQQRLGLPQPDYLHLPVAVNAAGEKLSKQTFATAIPFDNPVPLLIKALQFLGQKPDSELRDAEHDELLRWAIEHWRPEQIAAQRAIEHTG
ncbi:tRNA glutamyl-Q(34) synthetase GluQRS [Solemya pervernicosa gill symbiont]|uniref:Glutamyl-Q tRNA(Asp) synthetase n=1 Tax=Solemya pervernicosa gill symbiont TaxID=642797 RepID=A0A1T2L1N4_9GAMM|nr:tRNA glutamyl-Q(34) synthetase GluQRS [Solemya pervernicosa gill symbiont]OOZ38856.1 tRNA glutamyl-Q(34) synthetase GluQRS [Solemya pervernicosa gill symbiont]